MRWSRTIVVGLVVFGGGCTSQAEPAADDGGDSGVAANVEQQPVDAGVCTDDSQCPSGYYCDFTIAYCPNDGGDNAWIGTIIQGPCLPDLHDTSGQIACHTGDDCAEEELCFGPPPWGGPPSDEFYCTRRAPCDAGVCGYIPGPPEASCPAGCSTVTVPHTRDYTCICAGITCDGGGQRSTPGN